MTYAVIAMERAMKIQEVILRAMSGALTWPQAADILGMHPRSLRRWRARQQRVGYDGLLDRRRQRPSPRLAPFAEIERILRLYWERYAGFNVRHFHQLVRRDEHVTLSYTLVKTALQKAGLVAKRRAAGIAGAASPARASANCCIWTAALMPGSRGVPTSARR